MMLSASLIAAYAATLSLAKPITKVPRQVQELDQEATDEAHQRDETATRALSDVQITTSDGQCLFVDELSGDFRANLTPVQIAACGSNGAGERWDVITSGAHNDQPGQVLIVNTLTQACLNADPRRQQGEQIVLFSCGGRADGGGEVTNSQLFAFEGGADQSLTPANGEGFCLFADDGGFINIDPCVDGADAQIFSFGGGNTGGGGDEEDSEDEPASPSPTAAPPADDVDAPAITPAPDVGSFPSENPTEPVPVSRAGGVLNPELAAEAHTPDVTATKAREAVSIRAANNQCLSVDPTAGDFRQNLIPVDLVACDGSPNQQFDIVTAGEHNNGDAGAALIVSSLMGGCISFDPRRAAGDTVTIFSCGGRAAGEGETDSAQLYPFDGSDSIILEPANSNGEFCLTAGGARLDSAACSGQGDQVFEIV